ncbi:phospholipase D [Paenibacillus swuensis]|uniref:Cardiolipin synthase n=1 Tax=Paenibacillus swuensis TaxID=1178515 RepID=A0A172THP1_9BACL|nr:cardiolipin synthase [Paenibacillus swuensis]ANE46575.1 phospholipase D [Paenibacillus swuensis]
MTLWNQLSTYLPIINIVFAVPIIFLERRNAAVTWAWLMVLFFIPFFGFILYLLFGQNLSRRKIYRIKKLQRLLIENSVEHQKVSIKSGEAEYNDPAMQDYSDMMYMNLVKSQAIYSQNNEVEVFVDGKTKFSALFRDMEAATDHIHIIYYIIQNDDLGRKLTRALEQKAREGVEVRLMYDAIGSLSLPKHFFDDLKAAGGQVAAFFPSKIPYFNLRLNYRNHRKIAIFDGITGYIGGFNVGNEYLGKDEYFGFWRDTHLRVQGGAVHQLQTLFLMDWNLATPGMNSLESRYFPAVDVDSEGTTGMQIVSSGPHSETEQIKNAYIKMIHSAKKSIYLQTPYFIPDESLITALNIAAASGVDVKIMLPSQPDHKLVYWASFSYLGELLNAGVRCFLYEKGFLHAKTMVVDGKIASVGTANIDIRSFKLNFEVNALVYDTEIAGNLKAIFEEDMTHSVELSAEAYGNRSHGAKIKESFVRLLSPIL